MAKTNGNNGNNDMIEVQHQGMLKGKPPDPCIVVIFGASGDLAHKELIPSLFALNCQNLMPKQCVVIGFSRTEYSDDDFRKEMFEAVNKNSICGEDQWKEFAKNLFYIPGNFKDDPSKSYKRLKEKISQLQKDLKLPDNILFHLSTAPSFYSIIVKRLAESGLSKSNNGWRRVIIEKPFGTDEQSARELDRDIHEVFEENQIFRIDHFLGKETVQNMVVFRFANPGFEPIWNRNYIDNIQITVSEDIGIGSRAGFYEKTGVIRDMIQNHLFELLCMAAIDPPVNYDSTSLRSETLKVLNSICKINIERDVVLGQYDAGKMKDKQVNGYRDEKDVDKKSMTPTYAAIKLTLDNWRWAGVPVYLRTGKRMKQKLSEITIKFKPTPHLMFPINIEEEKKHNLLTFRLQPNEGILYTFTAKQPGAELQLRPVNLNFRYDRAFGIKEPPSSYQWLIRDAMQGDQTLFPMPSGFTNHGRLLIPLSKNGNQIPGWIFQIINPEAGDQNPQVSWFKKIIMNGTYNRGIMENITKYDAIIIGTGQSGVPLAEMLAAEGWKTALIERYLVGGSCINYGCTPSKTMEASSKVMHLTKKAEVYGVHNSKVELNLREVINRKKQIVSSFREGLEKGIEGTENLKLIRGEAEFADKKLIRIKLNNGGSETITADNIFINTGGGPLIPQIKGVDTVDFLTSTSIMELEEKPSHLMILGGGYIGLEFGQMFRRFGSQVTIIERGPQLLSREDEDIADELEKILRNDEINILKDTSAEEISNTEEGEVKLKLSAHGKENYLTGSHLLIAVGRKPNTESLNLKAAGIKTDKRGHITVNTKLQTNVKGIYAIGDVKGGPAFTHISYDDFRVIRDNLLRNKTHTIRNRFVPYTVFVDPQLGRIGVTEKEAREKGLNYKVAKMEMSHVARAEELGEASGIMKALVDASSGKILGCAILGVNGGEIAAMIQIAMMGNLKYTALKEGIFTHPTLAESLNTLFSKIN